MQAISDEFAAALLGGHIIASKADIFRDGALVAEDLLVTAGRVDVDATASVRRRCSLTIVDPTDALIPSAPAAALAPFGNEVRVSRGIVLPDGTTEYVGLGVFAIYEATATDDGTRSVQVEGYDRSRSVAEARFETPYTVAAGTNYASAIQALIDSRYPGLVFSLRPTTHTTPTLVFEEQHDPWTAAQKMAESIGCEVFFDGAGTVVLRSEPVPSEANIVATYAEGATATILSAANHLTAEGSYNIAIVTGESTSLAAPVRAVAEDTDPASPTYVGGRYGRRPTWLRSEFVTTVAQAQDAADALLLRKRGGAEQLAFAAVPNPALDAGDAVQVVRAGLGVKDFYVVEGVSIPLGVEGDMTVRTRRRRAS